MNTVLQNSVTFTCPLEADEGGSKVWKFSSMRSLLIVSLHFGGINNITTQVPSIFQLKLVFCKKIVVHTAIQLYPSSPAARYIPPLLLGHYPCSRRTENF